MKFFTLSLYFLLFFLSPSLWGSPSTPFAFFTPPPGWQIAKPSLFQHGVQIGFIQSKRKIFSPAISLTIEKIGKADVKKYLRAVRSNYHKNKNIFYRELGILQTKSGKAHLSLIDQKSQWGDIRILQAIVVQGGYAFIQTGTTLKEDFSKIRPLILKSFRSFTFSPDLLSSLSDLKERKEFKEKVSALQTEWKNYQKKRTEKSKVLFSTPFFQQNIWQPFSDDVIATFTRQGTCWQFLAIRAVRNSLLKNS